uniref:Uncharacterized protein n=1 Tax=Anguilla anguilla TaxID=7936 RepID=A0A0E9RK02_ANGAN
MSMHKRNGYLIMFSTEGSLGNFQDELDWCIQQLQTDLLTDNTNPHEGVCLCVTRFDCSKSFP